MKFSRVISIVFFVLVFQNCKTKKSVFNNNNIDINQNISYNNLINYNSNTYNITNKKEIASDSSKKPRQLQLESSLKKLSGFCAVVGVITNDKQTGQWVVGDNTNNGLNKQAQIQSKSTIKNLRNFTPVWEKVENKKTIVPIQEAGEQSKTGPIKTIRKGFVIIATLLLIAALLLLFFALLKWQSIFLLWSSISAGISYVLFKLGKKRLKTDWIDADKKQLKQLKKMALLVGLISGFFYLITLVF